MLWKLPESLGQLVSLTYFEVIGNQLRSLPKSIGNLSKLSKLDLRSNKIKELPQSIGRLSSLKILWLWENELGSLPDSIGGLDKLTSLNLGENKLQSLPDSIGGLSNLAILDLHSNQLRSLPDSIGQMSSLISLDLRCNQLKVLPNSIGRLSGMKNLDVSSNQIYILPDSITTLEMLESINLRDNQLSTLPDLIGSMQGLVRLECNSNRLEYVPDSIGYLYRLESLVLYKNILRDLPNSIALLPNLKEEQFFFLGNPWTEIPPEIVKQGSRSILRYCRQRANEGTFDWIYEAKLLVVGEGGAGKTTLANKLKDANYSLNNQQPTTKGIDVTHWDFRHPKGNLFRINIWDFGGQEIYHATHQFFLTKRSLYLLIADIRQENTDFNYWLEMVELLSEASPILIIKNEKQDRRCQVNESELRERFSSLERILATNLADNRGLSEIVDAVKFYIAQLPHVGTPLPKTWVYVRKALEEDPRNYITQTEFLALCDIHGFNSLEDKLQLSGYLHDLGVCLHFQDDPVLRNWIILKPEWGTVGVYKVLDTTQVNQNFGCFTQSDLAEIWTDEQYGQMRYELLQLMKNFKLCYEIPNRPQTYIAPQLLSPDQPDYDWNSTDNLILRYHYDFMPKGMLTRFIVEMHRLIDSELVWKEGVILTDQNARAEMIEAYYKKEIRIRISGKTKKPLLEAIRHEFRKIHDSYEKLRYQEYIPCNCATCHGSQTPHAYALQRLEERLRNDRQEIECDISYKMVSVRGLIDDAIGPDAYARSPAKADDRLNIDIHIGDRVGGDKMGGDQVRGNKTTP